MKRWRALHRSTRIAAIIGGVATLLVFGPISFAVLMLRCCESSRGAPAGAWVVIGIVLVVSAITAGALTGLLVAGIRRLLTGGQDNS
ncbi:MAG TPA: hypothetical protein VFS20_25210 [Longimicrobium sp.]|nr:hypothetical protein [Longimicrobium sp.]